MKKAADPHVVLLSPMTFLCLRCGEHYEMAMPALVDIVTGAMNGFRRTHDRCKKTSRGLACVHCLSFGHAPADCPRLRYYGDPRRWRDGPDTGLSSIAIYEKFMAAYVRDPAHPRDPSDFGRCHRLLAAIPEWRARIGEMAGVSSTWKALVTHWDELEALYLEESPSGQCPKLYARMCALRADE